MSVVGGSSSAASYEIAIVENVTAAWAPLTPRARATRTIAASTSSVWAPDPSMSIAMPIVRRSTRPGSADGSAATGGVVPGVGEPAPRSVVTARW